MPMEEPSRHAELNISLGPDQGGWGSVKGSVPPDQAHHLVTSGFIWGSVGAGIAGAVLTLRIASSLGILAGAELAASLAAAALIAACSFAESRRQKRKAKEPRGELTAQGPSDPRRPSADGPPAPGSGAQAA